jgi:hypothetical protein
MSSISEIEIFVNNSAYPVELLQAKARTMGAFAAPRHTHLPYYPGVLTFPGHLYVFKPVDVIHYHRCFNDITRFDACKRG